MRGVLLRDCVRYLRAEIRQSTATNVGMNTEDTHKIVLERVQQRLWAEWEWPHMIVTRDIPLSAGQRYYNVPADLPFERIKKAAVRDADRWCDLTPGIEESHYECWDSDLGERHWPPTRWDVTEDPQDTAGNIDAYGMIEVWPIPDRNLNQATLDATLRLTGVRSLRPFNADTHRCDLDHSLLVLYAASELLASLNQKDAQAKLQQATQLLMSVRGSGQKVTNWNMGGEPEEKPEGLKFIRRKW
jgi:hypothetical protein